VNELTNNRFVGDGDNLNIFVGEDGMRKMDLFDNAPYSFHAYRVSDDKGTRNDDAQTCVVV